MLSCFFLSFSYQLFSFYVVSSDAGYFTLNGADNPGIVHQLASTLANNNLSIERLATRQIVAPFGGTTLFHMEGIATASSPLPKGFNVTEIKNDVKELGDHLNCDISMEDIDDSGYSAHPL